MLSTAAIIGSKAKATAPATPTGLSVIEISGQKVYATWNISSGATGYDIRWQKNSGSWTTVDVGNTTNWTSSAFVLFDNVCVQVRAYNSSGDSSWSFSDCVVIGEMPV